jgi:putative toxin-antitoxin system antitoxin component (TIGR02293 family)
MAEAAEVRSLGLRAESQLGLAEKLQEGLPLAPVRRFLRRSGLSERRLAGVVRIPLRTWMRRKQEGRFSPEESERLARVARLFDLAEALLGSAAAARRWLEEPSLGLGGAVPLDAASSELGAREVEGLLLRIEHGVYS